MNRKEVAELLPIIQAFLEGRTIECRTRSWELNKGWRYETDWKETEQLIFRDTFEYRIKPEPKYRPFVNTEECWTEMQKHQPFGWLKQKDFRTNIANVMSKAITFADNEGRNFSFETVFKEYTFDDGAKFGIKEELL